MGTGKKASKRIKLKRRHLLIGVIGLGLLLVLLYARTLSPPQKDDSSLVRASTHSTRTGRSAEQGRGLPSMSPSPKPSLLRVDLLKGIQLLQTDSSGEGIRNIFQLSRPPEAAPPTKDKTEDKEEQAPREPVKPEINVKLVGIMGQQAGISQKELIRYAILSVEGEIVIAKKGDVVFDRYEVLQVEEESVDILVKETGQVIKLAVEQNTCLLSQSGTAYPELFYYSWGTGTVVASSSFEDYINLSVERARPESGPAFSQMENPFGGG